jgi:hypothetical protein
MPVIWDVCHTISIYESLFIYTDGLGAKGRPYPGWFRGINATPWTRLVSMEVLHGTVV